MNAWTDRYSTKSSQCQLLSVINECMDGLLQQQVIIKEMLCARGADIDEALDYMVSKQTGACQRVHLSTSHAHFVIPAGVQKYIDLECTQA